MASVGSIGKKVDLVITQGSTFIVPFSVSNAAGLPLDLTGCLVRSQIRKTYFSSDFISFTYIPNVSLVTGKFSLSLTASETSAITCGDSLSSPDSQYVWDVEIESPDGFVTKLATGKVLVYPEVTK